MSSHTGCEVSTEVPKSPCSALPTYIANCTGSGSFRPSSSRTRCTTCSGARSPTMASAGSTGITRPMKKVTASSPR